MTDQPQEPLDIPQVEKTETSVEPAWAETIRQHYREKAQQQKIVDAYIAKMRATMSTSA